MDIVMKKSVKIITAVSILLIIFSTGYFVFAGNDIMTVDVYLFDSCGGCYGDAGPCKPCPLQIEYTNKYNTLVKDNGLEGQVEIKVHNTVFPNIRTTYNELVATNNNIIKDSFPVMIAGDVVFNGDEEIDAGALAHINESLSIFSIFAGLFAATEDDDILEEAVYVDSLVYFSTALCGSCNEVEQYLDGLPKEFNSKVIVYSIDEGDNLELLSQYRELYDVSDTTLEVPAVFINDSYLVGVEQTAEYIDSLDLTQPLHTREID